jgi:predicted transcriptional regulator
MTVSIELSPDQARSLEEEAARSGQAPQEFIREAVQEKLDASRRRALRIQAAVEAGRIAWSGERLTPGGPVAATRGPEPVAELVIQDRR